VGAGEEEGTTTKVNGTLNAQSSKEKKGVGRVCVSELMSVCGREGRAGK